MPLPADPSPVPAGRPVARVALSSLLLAVVLWLAGGVCFAQGDGPVREPALDRDEQRRLGPEEAEIPSSAFEEFLVPPDVERRRQAELREALTPASPPEADVRIKALEGFVDYDQEDEVIYSPGRTQISYGRIYLEGDKVILDTRLQEIQAEGNVVLKIDEDVIHADSMRYNFGVGEGVAYNVSGTHLPVYFRSEPRRDEKGPAGPQFQRVSKNESLFRNTNVTTCDFKIPHYYVRGREVILYHNDRIFFRGATFYVWGMPMFYMPMYTRSLTEPSPWFTQLGYSTRTGAHVRLGYSYQHRVEEPSFEDEEEYETRSHGKANVFVDYLSKLGMGAGVDYTYAFEYNRHKGQLQVYGLRDGNREVVGAEPFDDNTFSESDRWQLLWRHRTEITKDLIFLANIDWFSDPDLFYDVLDIFSDDIDERNRQIERRSRVALTFIQEAYVARLMADVKDRVGIDRYTDFSDPADDNADFDLDPFNELQDVDVDGISRERWGRVSEKLPQFTVATRHLPIGRRPLFYDAQLEIYRSLDKGLNIVDDEDDGFVKGIELYQRLLRQWRLSQRYVLIGQVGIGMGYAERDDEMDVTFPGLVTDPGFPRTANNHPNHLGQYFGIKDGPIFIDDDGTFLVGRRRRNLDQIHDFYMWIDSALRLNARFSDALTGDVGWRWRETTNDFIGDWYASLGSLTFREDLFNYKIREHWVDGGLNYRLVRPLLTLYTRAGYNLESRSNVYSQEPLAFWMNGARWSNARETLILSGGFGIRREQVYDPSDPRAYEENVFTYNARLDYSPIHGRWYTSLRLDHQDVSSGRTEAANSEDFTFFTDEDTETEVRWIYGRELGPKYDMEFAVEWDKEIGGLREVAWLLQRDLHDAIAVLKVASRTDDRHADSRNDDSSNQLDVRLGLKFKLPGQEVAFGAGDVRTLKQRAREPQMEY